MAADDPVEAAKAAAAKKAAAVKKAAAAKKTAAAKNEPPADGDAEPSEEDKASAEAAAAEETKKDADEEKAKKEAEAKKKAEEARKKKEAADAKAAAELAEALSVFKDENLVLLAKVATTQERMDFLTSKGIPTVAIKAAMADVGVKEVGYQRDAWGRIIALNDVKFSQNAKPPPSDSFGQQRAADAK